MKAGIRGKLLQLIRNLYEHVRIKVRTFGGEITDAILCELGVMQGESLSPLLFAMYLNDMEAHFLQYGENGVDIGDCHLMLLLYADDAVILSYTPTGLQTMLDNLLEYTTKWKLEVNIDKTKILVFRKGHRLPRDLKFHYNNAELDMVNTFVYLGIVFSHTGIFTNAQRTIADQGRKAMFQLLKYIQNFVNIKPSVTIDLFDKLVRPVLMYCSEAWGFHRGPDIEALHIQFCKKLLHVKRSTPNDMVLGEMRRVPCATWRHVSIVKYWLKILHMDINRNVFKLYRILYEDCGRGKLNWATHVKDILQECGLGYAWLYQTVGNVTAFRSLFKQRITDIYGQKWRARLRNTSRGHYYLAINTDMNLLDVSYSHFETVKSSKNMYSLIKLRTCSHRLRVETGRWHRPQPIPLMDRKCDVCEVLDDEYHFVMVCRKHEQIRRTFIPSFYWTRPNMLKFINLFTNQDCINSIAKFTSSGFEQRSANI